MALVQTVGRSVIWEKWIDCLTGHHGIEEAALVKQDGTTLANSRGIAVSKQEILELSKYFRSPTSSSSVSSSDSGGSSSASNYQRTRSLSGDNEVRSQGHNRFTSIFHALRRSNSTSSRFRSYSCTSDTSSDTSSDGVLNSAISDDLVKGQGSQGQTAVGGLLSMYLQGRFFVVRSRSTDQILAFSGATNIIVMRSKRTYLIAVCASRQVVPDACGFMAELKQDLVKSGY